MRFDLDRFLDIQNVKKNKIICIFFINTNIT